MPRRRNNPNECLHGHDLTVPENVYEVTKTGAKQCAVCRRMRVRRHRAAHGKVHKECARCGRPKYRDERRLCFGCRAATLQHPIAAATCDRMLSDTVLLESAPTWVRRDPAEHRAWLEARRRELMRQR